MKLKAFAVNEKLIDRRIEFLIKRRLQKETGYFNIQFLESEFQKILVNLVEIR